MTVDKFIIREDTTILQTLKCLNENREKIAYLCDEKERLLASVSDGDVRGYLVSNGEMTAPISEVANYNPIFLSIEERSNAENIMKEKRITSVPIINRERRVIDIIFMDHSKVEFANLQAPFVIMAGGKGLRLLPYTTILPKPLIPIGETSITEHIMAKFNQYGCRECYMIVNYKKELIKAYFECNALWKVHFIDELEYLGTAGGLKLLPTMNEPYFMTNCDVIFDVNYEKLYSYHKKSNNVITIVCTNSKVTIPYGILDIDSDGYVTRIDEKPSYSFNMNAGLYVLNPEVQGLIKEEEKLDMPDLLKRCLAQGKRVGSYFIDESEWMDIGQLDEYEKTKKRLGMV